MYAFKEIEEAGDILTRANIDRPLTGIGNGEFKNIAYGSKGNRVQLVQNVAYTKKACLLNWKASPDAKLNC